MKHSFSRQFKHAIRMAVRRSPLAPVARAIVKRPDPFAAAIQIGRSRGWEAAGEWLLRPEARRIITDRAVLSTLREKIGDDVDRELLLTEVRRLLLLDGRRLLLDDAVCEFTAALAQQCINNEHVYYVSDAEKKALDELRKSTGGPKSWDAALLLALYDRPERFVGDLGFRWDDGATPQPARALFDSYTKARDDELRLRAGIPAVTAVENPGSQPVAAMYEENPYPRWLSMTLRRPGSRIDGLRHHFAQHELPSLDRKWRVLAAGCGTGRDALAIASGYGEQAEVLAIDISRASLAYAARMARRYGVQNIRFMQCDIHAVSKLQCEFDIVESSGVLHHLRKPLEGWRALVDTLRPGGLMYIALYSRLARREIVRIRDDVSRRGRHGDVEFLRQYRRELMLGRRDLIDGSDLPNRWDFFSTSACMDLLFHVLEHQYTIPELRQSVDALGLEYRGFELPPLLPERLWSAYPTGKDWLNLDKWWAFEQKHPNTFTSLYSFWSRKPQ
jgi:SAM-dependent methyltransferase